MGRPKGGYGKGIVGVTTVLSVWGANKGALMYWAWDQGRQGFDFRDTRDQAATAGTLAHDMIDADLRKLPMPSTAGIDQEIIGKAETAFLNFLEWARLVDFQLVESELSLVDEEMGFAGTMDKVTVKGNICITDFKTAKAVYADNWVQLAAYGHLWNLHHPMDPVQDYYILQLGREDAAFSYHHKRGLEKQWQLFTHLLAVYKLGKEIK